MINDTVSAPGADGLSPEGRELLKDGARRLGVELKPTDVDLFSVHYKEMTRWRERADLTSITDERGVVIRHFLDSLSLVKGLPLEGAILDLGTGAGFPGIPIKIARPALAVALLERSHTKVLFLKHLVRELNLPGVSIIEGDAKEVAKRPDRPGPFQVVVSRATTKVVELLKLAQPFLTEGSRVVAMKGPGVTTELERFGSSPQVNTFRVVGMMPFTLPFSNEGRTIVIFERVGATTA